MNRIFLIALFLLLTAPSAFADGKTTKRIHVAVASNFILPFQELSRAFTAKSGIDVEATYASSGQLYAQIQNGAPYDLFLSADEDRPSLLHRHGRAEAPFIYAIGRVVLWTSRKDLCRESDWRRAIALPGMQKIAIANPKTAPYGAAAMEALEKTGLKDLVGGKLVFAQNIAQVFHYAATGSVDAGFCAFSSALNPKGRTGCTMALNEASPVQQGACILKGARSRGDAAAFVAFLRSNEAETVKRKFGYH